MSIIQDPEVYERFEQVILIHGVRTVSELAYRDFIEKELPHHEYLGEEIAAKLRYYPTVTREPFVHQGRITTLVESGKLFEDLGIAPFDAAEDRRIPARCWTHTALSSRPDRASRAIT
jgi:ferredoxin--NADP+ reductase